MSIPLSRNIVIPVWFAVLALFTIVGPPLNLFVLVFLITAGLAVPAMAFVLWHDPPRPVAVVAVRGDAIPRGLSQI